LLSGTIGFDEWRRRFELAPQLEATGTEKEKKRDIDLA
jgi:hypothetical protein